MQITQFVLTVIAGLSGILAQMPNLESQTTKGSRTPSAQIEPGWLTQLQPMLESAMMGDLKSFLQSEIASGAKVYPKPSEWFAAFNQTPWDSVRVVILGQDPYHGPGQAHGLSFSVQPGVKFPPSLQNIFKELRSDLGFNIPQTGCLLPWAKQGVLLLNSVLTVKDGAPASHQGRGWEEFTDYAIARLAQEKSKLAFVLWGSYAQKKGRVIDKDRHFVLETPHPSPLSAHRGFFGSRPFSKVNTYLEENSTPAINWNL